MKRVTFSCLILIVFIHLFTGIQNICHGLEVGVAEPVPGFSPTRWLTFNYVTPDAQFMLLQVWDPYWRIKSSTWDANLQQWTSPQELPTDPLGGFPVGTMSASLSPDGMTMYYGYEGIPNNVCRSLWTQNGWTLPPEIVDPCLDPAPSDTYFNGKYFYTTHFYNDIWVSTYDPVNNQFSPSVPVESISTSEWSEQGAWISSDNNLLVFSSDRPGGYGHHDLYSATWDEDLKIWINITNLGPNVNTTSDEYNSCMAEEAGILFFERHDPVTDQRQLMQAVVEPEAPYMVLIPCGEFEMGDHFSPEGYDDELPVHAVLLDSFFMSKFQITNQQYCDYLNSAKSSGQLKVVGGTVYASSDSGNSYPYCDMHSHSQYSQIKYSGGVFSVRTKGQPPRNMSDDPMVEVSWYGAAAYCNWLSKQEGFEVCYNLSTWECDISQNGYRLPTEAEWEYAARGGQNSPYYRFPWGDTISHSQANYYANLGGYTYDVSLTSGYHPLWNGVNPDTSPVGFFDGTMKYKADYNWPGSTTSYQTTSGANGYGLYDMAGNVWEWCNDWYNSTYYSTSPYDNPQGPASGTYRVLRGSSWADHAYDCRVTYRSAYNLPVLRTNHVGYRIVRTLGTAEGWIAFSSAQDGDPDIWAIRPDGTGLRQLVNMPGGQHYLGWSPDSTKIVYSSDSEAQLWVYDWLAGTNTKIYDAHNYEGQDLGSYGVNQTAWSPDGSKILFREDASYNNPQITVINADGTARAVIPVQSGYVSCPRWSPDGTAFVYDRRSSGHYHDLWIYDFTSTGDIMNGVNHQLTQGASSQSTTKARPDWTPNGKIVFTWGYNIAVIDPGQSPYWTGPVSDPLDPSVTFLTDDASYPSLVYESPSWSPDLSRIVYDRRISGGTYNLWAMDASGDNRYQLAALPGHQEVPDWGNPPEETEWSFVHMTDTHIGYRGARGKLARLVQFIRTRQDPKPDFIVVTGDIADQGCGCWNCPCPRSYDQFLKAIKQAEQAGIEVYTLPGNHDRRNGPFYLGVCYPDLECYYDTLQDRDLVNSGFSHNGVYFVGLDTGSGNCSGALTTADINFLNGLEKTVPKIILTHHPAVDEDREVCDKHIVENNEPFINYCENPDNNVYFVLSGHTHEDHVYDQNLCIPTGYPQYIQTPSVGKDQNPGFRIVEVKGPPVANQVKYVTKGEIPNIEDSLYSAGQLHLYDSSGRHTGLVGVDASETEIPNSFYFDHYVVPGEDANEVLPEQIIIFDPCDGCLHEVVGTEAGTYRLEIRYNKDENETVFEANDIPTLPNSVHQYTIDWDGLSQGEEGVTLRVDRDGDSDFERVITSDSMLTGYEFSAQFVVYGLHSLHLQQAVITGDVGAKNAQSVDWINPRLPYEIEIGAATINGSAYGDTIKLGPYAHVTGDAYCNEAIIWYDYGATLDGSEVSPILLPVLDPSPAFPVFAVDIEDITINSGDILTLQPGDYAKVELKKGYWNCPTVLQLKGGVYNLGELVLGYNTRVECLNPCEIRIKGRLSAVAVAAIVPAVESDLSAADIQIFVEGINGATGGVSEIPKAIVLGKVTDTQARIYAPNGTIEIGGFKTTARGVFIGKWVKIFGRSTTVTLE